MSSGDERASGKSLSVTWSASIAESSLASSFGSDSSSEPTIKGTNAPYVAAIRKRIEDWRKASVSPGSFIPSPFTKSLPSIPSTPAHGCLDYSQKSTDKQHGRCVLNIQLDKCSKAWSTDPAEESEEQRDLEVWSSKASTTETPPSSNCNLFELSRIQMPSRALSRELEARRLADVLNLAERGKLSQNFTRWLLQTDAVAAQHSYDVLIRHIQKRAKVKKRFALMCREEHAALTGPLANSRTCPSLDCTLPVSRHHMFWYSLISEQLQALCSEKDSFEQIMMGCRRARRSMLEGSPTTLFDYYDGTFFRRMHGKRMEQWDERREIFVFLTMSSDGFDLFKERGKKRSAWPVIFMLLNLDVEERFHALNSLVAAFIPGQHDSDQFDTFIAPIVDDLATLEMGINCKCADGISRRLVVHVLFFTADWPAASKIFGFVGHTGKKGCRRCHKEGRKLCGGGGVVYLPHKESLSCIDDSTFFELEGPGRRSNTETRGVWKEIRALQSRKFQGQKKAMRKLIQETGIKRKPKLCDLSLDFVQSLPYDPMHLCLLGWVKLIAQLSTGYHPKCALLQPSYAVSSESLQVINCSLESGTRGIPSTWGRPPLSLERLSHYKAEDLKHLGLYLGPILFDGDVCTNEVTMVWALTAEFLHIVFNPTPTRKEVNELKGIIHRAYCMFCRAFQVKDEHPFCFTPTTHALLHIPEMLRECGPLLNVSQFVVERFIGEIGPMVKSFRRAEANLFNKSFTLFSLRLLNRGNVLKPGDKFLDGEQLEREVDVNSSEESEALIKGQPHTQVTMRGNGKVIGGKERGDQALAYIEQLLPVTAHEIRIRSIKSFTKANVGSVGAFFDVETQSCFRAREEGGTQTARQKCWIAGQFYRDIDSDAEDGCEERKADAYYGLINEIWEIRFCYRTPAEQLLYEDTCTAARIDWLNGLITSHRSGTVFTHMKNGPRVTSIRNKHRTVEDLSCIKRVIGFFDHHKKRYFLDPEQRMMGREEDVRLCGVAKAK